MMATPSIIQARHAALYVDTAAITFDAATSLDQETGSGTAFKVKNLTVTPPKYKDEKVDLLGESAQTIGAGIINSGTFQNAVFDQGAASEASGTCTVVLEHDEPGLTTPAGDNLFTLAAGNGTDITDDPAFTRYTFGDSATNLTRLEIGTLIFVLNNGEGILNIVMTNVLVSPGEIKPTGADGHWEMDWEFKCLPKDFAIELED